LTSFALTITSPAICIRFICQLENAILWLSYKFSLCCFIRFAYSAIDAVFIWKCWLNAIKLHVFHQLSNNLHGSKTSNDEIKRILISQERYAL